MQWRFLTVVFTFFFFGHLLQIAGLDGTALARRRPQPARGLPGAKSRLCGLHEEPEHRQQGRRHG